METGAKVIHGLISTSRTATSCSMVSMTPLFFLSHCINEMVFFNLLVHYGIWLKLYKHFPTPKPQFNHEIFPVIS